MSGILRRIFRGAERAPHHRIEPAVQPSSDCGPLPADAVFLDVETTGFHSDDRIVSLAMIFPTFGRTLHDTKIRASHSVFDPCKKSHPEAEAVHGYDDWTLRHQPMFFEEAKEIHNLLSKSKLIVAHNIQFDVGFLNYEFGLCGLSPIVGPLACTMAMSRERGLSARLKDCASRYGLNRRLLTHDAFEDAFLCMHIYMAMQTGWPVCEAVTPIYRPTNMLHVPPRPVSLPRRNNIARMNERMVIHSAKMP